MNQSKNDLYQSSLKLLKPLNLQQTYKIIVYEAMKLVGGSSGSIIILREGKMVRAYSSDARLNTVIPQKRGRSYKAYKNQEAILLSKKDMEGVHPEFSNIEVNSNLLIPLINRKKTIGVLSIYKSGENKFSRKDTVLLKNFSPMASMAIRKAQLYAELNRSVETRDLFLSLASHELKTPITTIYVYLQLMQRNLKKNRKFDPNWIDTLLNEMVRLTKIVDDLLELSRIRTGKLNYSFIESDIKQIIKRAMVSFKANHKNELKFEDHILEKDKFIVADFDKLIGVIINILDNSVKHSPKDKPITISASANRREIIISIKDEGKGIPREDLKKVFEGFFKVENNTMPGMGLGLFLSKQIIDAHHGKIKIKSQLDQGTTVSIYLNKVEYKLGKPKRKS